MTLVDGCRFATEWKSAILSAEYPKALSYRGRDGIVVLSVRTEDTDGITVGPGTIEVALPLHQN
ncbi:MAG: hypothetical protein ABW137_19225 [Mycobacterium sp.]